MPGRGVDSNHVEIVWPAGSYRAGAALGGSRYLAPLLGFGALLYGSGVAVLRAFKLRRRRPLAPSPIVISVGNIEVGGTGKTPLAMHLTRMLSARGEKPVYASRGYKSRAERLPIVTLVPPKGETVLSALGPGVRIINRDSPSLWLEIGDEATMVARLLPDVPLVVSRRKRKSIELASSLFGASHVVIDDGFQSWNVPRHVDIVLLSTADVVEHARLLPLGTLRECAGELARADLIGIGGEPCGEGGAATIERTVGRRKPVFFVRKRAVLVDCDDRAAEVPRGAVASLSSVCDPESFDRMLLEMGLDLRLSIRYPDHYSYRRSDLPEIERWVVERGVELIVLTAKDWAKLEGCDLGIPMLVSRMELEVVGLDLYEQIKKPQR